MVTPRDIVNRWIRDH